MKNIKWLAYKFCPAGIESAYDHNIEGPCVACEPIFRALRFRSLEDAQILKKLVAKTKDGKKLLDTVTREILAWG